MFSSSVGVGGVGEEGARFGESRVRGGRGLVFHGVLLRLGSNSFIIIFSISLNP